MKKPETKFKEKAIEDLKLINGLFFIKTQEVSKRGVPDLLICYHGRFIAIELKKDEHEAPDELQKYRLQKIQECGGKSFVAHPKNWGDVLLKIGSL